MSIWRYIRGISYQEEEDLLIRALLFRVLAF
jgi:hypothetical protein